LQKEVERLGEVLVGSGCSVMFLEEDIEKYVDDEDEGELFTLILYWAFEVTTGYGISTVSGFRDFSRSALSHGTLDKTSATHNYRIIKVVPNDQHGSPSREMTCTPTLHGY
jgi:hypothetical protein